MSWLNDAVKQNKKIADAKKEKKENIDSEINVSGKKIRFAVHYESMLSYMVRNELETISIEGVEYTREDIESLIDKYWERYLREEAKYKAKVKDLPAE